MQQNLLSAGADTSNMAIKSDLVSIKSDFKAVK